MFTDLDCLHRRLGLFLKKTLKLYPSLKSYFLSQNSEMKDDKQKQTRNRQIKSLSNEMQEVCLKFLQGAPSKLIHLNLWLQWSDPIIHLIDGALFDTIVLLSWFMSPHIVTQYKHSELSDGEISFLFENEGNQLSK